MNRRILTLGKVHGVASLAVVLVLFFILAMVAAYTNRNLIFEQRTSANSYRSARALAAADAAIDWTVAMLNGGAIDAQCQPSSAPADDDFKTRYLRLQPDGSFRAIDWPTSDPNRRVQAQPACAANNTGGWNCSCIKGGPPAQLNAAQSNTPVFAVSIGEDGRQKPGALALVVRGCHVVRTGVVDSSNVNSDGSCHVNGITTAADLAEKANVTADAVALLRVSLGLVSALPVAPTAAVTARGDITQSSGMLSVANPDPATGLTLMAGGAIPSPSALNLAGPAGAATSPTDLVSDHNDGLMQIDSLDFFRVALGLPENRYKQQPAVVTCSSGCDLPSLSAQNPTRVIFIEGNATLDSITLGTKETPVLLVATGNVTIDGSTTAIRGVIFAGGNLTWNGAGSKVEGAIIVRGNYIGTANAAISYDREIVRRIHKSYGSFVRIPGSWNTES